MEEKFAVVVNISNRDVRIPELRQILPGGAINERFVLPYEIAIKYKQYLHPVAIIDPKKQDGPIEETKQKRKVKIRPKTKPLKGIKIREDYCPAKAQAMKAQRSRYTYKKKQGQENEIQKVSTREE